MMLHVLIAMVAGWIQRHQQQVIAYLQEENRVLKAQLGPQRLRLTDTERRRLAVLAYPLLGMVAWVVGGVLLLGGLLSAWRLSVSFARPEAWGERVDRDEL